MLMPTVLRPQYQSIIAPTIASDADSFDGYGIVQEFRTALLTKTGGRVRVTFKPPSGAAAANTVIASAYVGMANTAPSFDGAQVQLLRESDGATSWTLTKGGSPVTTVATFRPTTSGTLLVAFGLTTASVVRNLTLTSDYVTHYKAAASTDAPNTSKSGYSTASTTTSCWCVSQVEVLN